MSQDTLLIQREEDPRKRLGLLTVILCLPLILALLGAWQVFQDGRKKRLGIYETRLQEILTKLDILGNPQEYFQHVLARLEGRVFNTTDPQRTFFRLSKELKRRFPGTFTFTFLDSGGNPVGPLCDAPPPRLILKRFFKACQEFEDGNRLALDNEKSVVQGFLGLLFPTTGDILQKLLAAGEGQNQFAFVSRMHPQGMFLVQMDRGRNWQSLALRERVGAVNRRSSRLRIFLFRDLSEPVNKAGFFDISPSRMRDLLKGFTRGLKNIEIERNSIWGWRIISPNLKAIWRFKIPDSSPRPLKFGWLLLLGIASCWIIRKLIGQEWGGDRYLSLRTKLVLAFFLTAGFPLLIIGITAHSYISEYREVLEKNLHQKIEQALVTFDGNFPNEKFGMEFDFRRQFQEAFQGVVSPSRDIIPIIDKIWKTFHVDQVKIINSGGRTVYERTRKLFQSQRKRSNRILSRLAPYLLRNLDFSNASGSSPILSLTEAPLIPSEDTEMLLFFNLAVTGFGSIHEIKFFTEREYLSYQQMYLPVSGKRYLVLIWWDMEKFLYRYITRNLIRFSRQLPETRLAAFHLNHRKYSYPEKSISLPGFQRLLASRALLGTSLRKKIQMNGNTTLLTGYRGKFLENFYFMAASRDRSIRLEISRLTLNFGLVALVVLFMSLIIAQFLSQRLLNPIGKLAQGLHEIGEKRFNTMIPVFELDEVGKLSQTFNGMMAGFADLELARIVQETYFPGAPLRQNDWEVYGYCLAAAQVGGDYFDYFAIDENHLGIMVGDVSGHGVSAALVVGMAKALMAHPGTGNDPVQSLEIMHHVFLSTLKKRKMMTCFFLIIDTRTGKARGANGGHLYPFLVGPRTAEFWKVEGSILGVTRKVRFLESTVTLNEGEWLLLYTDGLIEAPGRTGESIGFGPFQRGLPELVGVVPRETEKKIRAWHDGLTRSYVPRGGNSPGSAPPGGLPLDDQTLVVIQRVAAPRVSAQRNAAQRITPPLGGRA